MRCSLSSGDNLGEVEDLGRPSTSLFPSFNSTSGSDGDSEVATLGFDFRLVVR